MGVRKRQRAEVMKEKKKHIAFAKLNDCPTSPRKMRLVADTIRNEKVDRALDLLKFSSKEASRRLEKLLLSAVTNWKTKNEDSDEDIASLYIKELRVDSGSFIKRLRTAPQGRAHRIRKRSNHVTLIVAAREIESKTKKETEVKQKETKVKQEEKSKKEKK